MDLVFRWDAETARTNLRKHGISFEEARTIFSDPRALTFPDEKHSREEDRYITIGTSARGKISLVVHSDRWQPEDSLVIRIISCRRAPSSERRVYVEGEA